MSDAISSKPLLQNSGLEIFNPARHKLSFGVKDPPAFNKSVYVWTNLVLSLASLYVWTKAKVHS